MKILIAVVLALIPFQTFADTNSIFRSFKKIYCEDPKAEFAFKKECLASPFLENFEQKLKQLSDNCDSASGWRNLSGALGGAGSHSLNKEPCQVNHIRAKALLTAYFQGADSIQCGPPAGATSPPAGKIDK